LEKDTRNADLYYHGCPEGHGAWIEQRHIPARLKLELGPKHLPGVATRINHRYSPAFPKTKMDIVTFQGMDIDICPRTKGIWLDKDEILPVLLHIIKTNEEYADLVKTEQISGGYWLSLIMELLGIFMV